MYRLETYDDRLTVDPIINIAEVYTIGVGGATITIPPGSAVTQDEELYIIDDAVGDILPPNVRPQCAVQQSVGSTIGTATLYYGSEDNLQEKSIPSTTSFGGVIKKDKNFSYYPSGPIMDEIGDGVNILVYWPVYGRNLTGKRLALTRVVEDSTKHSLAVMSSEGVITFFKYEAPNFIEDAITQSTFDSYLAGIPVTADDKKAVDVEIFESTNNTVIGIVFRGGFSLLVDTTRPDAIITVHPDVEKIVYGKLLTRSKKFMLDDQNLTFIPLYDDGVHDDIVNVWSLPSYDTTRYITHRSDGSYVYTDGGSDTTLTITGSPFDFLLGYNPSTSNHTLYAVHHGYRLVKIFGVGPDTLRVANYSYQPQAATLDRSGIEVITNPAALLFNLDGTIARVDDGTSTVYTLASNADQDSVIAAWTTTEELRKAVFMKTNLPLAEIESPMHIHSITGAFTGDYFPQYGTTEDTKDPFTWADVRNEK